LSSKSVSTSSLVKSLNRHFSLRGLHCHWRQRPFRGTCDDSLPVELRISCSHRNLRTAYKKCLGTGTQIFLAKEYLVKIGWSPP
jgi:hypothetical protein